MDSEKAGIDTDDLCEAFAELIEKIKMFTENIGELEELVVFCGPCSKRPSMMVSIPIVRKCYEAHTTPFPGKAETSNRRHLKKPP